MEWRATQSLSLRRVGIRSIEQSLHHARVTGSISDIRGQVLSEAK